LIVDISGKNPSHRLARAQAVVWMPSEVCALLQQRALKKGDALEFARAAAFLAAKKTDELLPLCHPLPLTHATVDYEFGENWVRIETHIETTAATGVEMEALTAASIAALTLYDLLKAHAGADLLISDVFLLEKQGGKTPVLRSSPSSQYKPHLVS
jgi:cyclic pyranopterin phosphate synthase